MVIVIGTIPIDVGCSLRMMYRGIIRTLSLGYAAQRCIVIKTDGSGAPKSLGKEQFIEIRIARMEILPRILYVRQTYTGCATILSDLIRCATMLWKIIRIPSLLHFFTNVTYNS